MAPKQINEVEAKSWGKDHDIAVYNWMLENDVEDDAGNLPTGKHLLTDTPALKSWSSSTLNSKMKTIRRRMKEKKDWHPLNDKLPMRLGLESTVKKLNAEEESDNPLYDPEYMPISSIHQSGGSSTPKPFKPSTSQPQSACQTCQAREPIQANPFTCQQLHQGWHNLRWSPAPVHDQAQHPEITYQPTAAFVNYFHTDTGAEEFRYLINLPDAVDFNPTMSRFVYRLIKVDDVNGNVVEIEQKVGRVLVYAISGQQDGCMIGDW
ncbi:hypothetical protein BJ741DRAFT_655430 [Chytriomyces cf. hyalinus JEL632]|nr:hypothetical protein BJ741DRAFT_655430 [Chytriomyces cf. hyalinus JEL632]